MNATNPNPIYLSFFRVSRFEKPTCFVSRPFLNQGYYDEQSRAKNVEESVNLLGAAIIRAMVPAEPYEIDGGWQATRFYFSGVIERSRPEQPHYREYEIVNGYTSPADAITEDLKLYVTHSRTFDNITSSTPTGHIKQHILRTATGYSCEIPAGGRGGKMFDPGVHASLSRIMAEGTFGSFGGYDILNACGVLRNVGKGWDWSAISPKAVANDLLKINRKVRTDFEPDFTDGPDDRLADITNYLRRYSSSSFIEALFRTTNLLRDGFVTMADLRESVGVSSSYPDRFQYADAFQSHQAKHPDVRIHPDAQRIVHFASMAIAELMPKYNLRRIKFDYGNFDRSIKLSYLVNNTDFYIPVEDGPMAMPTDELVKELIKDALAVVNAITDRPYRFSMDIFDGMMSNVTFGFDGEEATEHSIPLFAVGQFHSGCTDDHSVFDDYCRDLQTVALDEMFASHPSPPDVLRPGDTLPWDKE